MDVIINNPSAQTVVPQTVLPQPYATQGYPDSAPIHGYYLQSEHGPGPLLPLLLIGGALLFFRARRNQWRNRRRMWAARGMGPGNMGPGNMGAGQPSMAGADGGAQTSSQTSWNEEGRDWGEEFRRGRERFLGSGLFGGNSDKALDIARERYARGEIDADQYAEVQRNLEKQG